MMQQYEIQSQAKCFNVKWLQITLFLHTSEKHCAFRRTRKSKGTLEDLTQFSFKEHIYNASLLSLFIVGQSRGGHGMPL